MKKLILWVLAQLAIFTFSYGQVFQKDTLQYKGDSNKYINLVIMGDGYTASEQAKFITDATNLSTYLFSQSPFSNYKNFFNVFAIKVISTNSGIKHPNNASDCAPAAVPVSNPSTYFGSTFDAYGIHRLVVPFNTANIANTLSANYPNYDQVFIVANSVYYGGSGGNYATATVHEASNEISAHEIGHSFAKLGDEYYAGDVYAAEKPNMTQQTNPTLVKWKNWVGTGGVGVHQFCCGGNSAVWYKPHTNCKMQLLNAPFCNVCKETTVEKIHSLVNLVVNYTPTTSTVNSASQLIDFKLTKLMKPVSNTLKIQWRLNGNIVANQRDSVKINQSLLANGAHTLTATVTDTTALVRVNNHATVHANVVSWTINKTTTSIDLVSQENKLSYNVFPNPASNQLNVSVEAEKKCSLSVQLVSLDGKILQQISDEVPQKGEYQKTFNIEQLAKGTYLLVLNVGGSVQTQTFVKE